MSYHIQYSVVSSLQFV